MSDSVDGARRELDAIHTRVAAALAERNVEAYLAFLHPELTYTRMDGASLDKARLAADVRRQFGLAERMSTSFRRESLELTGDGASEVLHQVVRFGVRAFLVIHREWTVDRTGSYEWVHDAAGWRIKRVRVASERTSSRWRLGWSDAPAQAGSSEE